jgi:hypothetical protein
VLEAQLGLRGEDFARAMRTVGEEDACRGLTQTYKEETLARLKTYTSEILQAFTQLGGEAKPTAASELIAPSAAVLQFLPLHHPYYAELQEHPQIDLTKLRTVLYDLHPHARCAFCCFPHIPASLQVR